MIDDVVQLTRVFGSLSLLTLGGGMAAYPQLRTLVVDVHRWLTASQLDYLFGVGQAAPGPNMMMVVSIGTLTAGLPGAVMVLVAFLGPTTLLTWSVGRVWTKLRGRPLTVAVQRGLTPVSIGLLLAGCLTFAKGALTGWPTTLVALVAFVVVLRGRRNPALLILGGAVVGLLLFRT
jgi:chromate transporter